MKQVFTSLEDYKDKIQKTVEDLKKLIIRKHRDIKAMMQIVPDFTFDETGDVSGTFTRIL